MADSALFQMVKQIASDHAYVLRLESLVDQVLRERCICHEVDRMGFTCPIHQEEAAHGL